MPCVKTNQARVLAVCGLLFACDARVAIDGEGGGAAFGDDGVLGAPWGAPGCGQAEPTTLAESPGAGDLAIDGDTIFWIVDDGVWAMPSVGGPPRQLVSGHAPPRALAVDEGFVYFTSNDTPNALASVSRVPRAGGPVELLWSDTYVVAGAIAVGADGLYFGARWGWSEDDDRSGLVRVPKAGGQEEWLVDEQSGLGPLALDGEFVYFHNTGEMDDFGAGALCRLDTATGEVTILADAPAPASPYELPLRTLVVLDGDVIWAEHAPSYDLLRRVSVAGGPLETLAFTDAGAWIGAIASDGERVLWATQGIAEGVGPIQRLAPGGAPETLREDAYGVQALAIEPGSVLWTEPGSPGEVLRACVPD